MIGGLREILHPCNVPEYAGLSQARRDELAQSGVTPDQWNALRNKQRLGYFNIVAAIAAAALSLLGWLVDWAAGGIQQDRTFFKQGPGATNLLAQVRNSSIFSRGSGALHGEYNVSYRLNSSLISTQLSFTSDGLRLDADIDIFNPNRFPSALGHIFEVLAHVFGRFFGGGTRTNPYNVGSRKNWECI